MATHEELTQFGKDFYSIRDEFNFRFAGKVTTLSLFGRNDEISVSKLMTDPVETTTHPVDTALTFPDVVREVAAFKGEFLNQDDVRVVEAGYLAAQKAFAESVGVR